ncbi:MAG: response regulator transcription factor [Saprospiraceae bacterium]
MKTIRVVLFDDNIRVRDSISMLLSAIPGIEFTGAFPDCNDLEKILKHSNPDVILMDIDMPGKDGVEAVKDIRKLKPEIKILMQTVFDDADRIFSAICSGAHGYLLKNTAPLKIIESIQDVYQGGAPMTPEVASKVLKMLVTNQTVSENDYKLSGREKDVLRLLVDGKSYKMIGSDLTITYDTVRAHIKKIYEKLHVSSMTEAVAKAIHHKIV